jgi:ABC-type multidrug transport system fused ATPase/permease subunit
MSLLIGAIGIPKPWYFPFQTSYWFGHNRDKRGGHNRKWWNCCFCKNCEGLPAEPEQGGAMLENLEGDDGDELFEPDPENLPLGVSIVNLCKRYKGAQKFAVKNLNLNFFEGQITALLGHNGAGKTTTM